MKLIVQPALVAALSLFLLEPAVRSQEPRTTARIVLEGPARVERIDRFSRSLTLRTNEGLLHTVYVDPTLTAFDDLQSGDTVTVRVVESVVVAVRPGAKPKVIAETTAAARKEAADGSGEILQQLKMTVTIEKVDRQVVTYRTADNRTVIRAVADPHLIEGLKRGDVVEVTLTRERAIALERSR